MILFKTLPHHPRMTRHTERAVFLSSALRLHGIWTRSSDPALSEAESAIRASFLLANQLLLIGDLIDNWGGKQISCKLHGEKEQWKTFYIFIATMSCNNNVNTTLRCLQRLNIWLWLGVYHSSPSAAVIFSVISVHTLKNSRRRLFAWFSGVLSCEV